MKFFTSLISFIFLLLTALQTKAQPSLQQEAETIFSDPTFAQASVGLCVRTSDGTELAKINADKLLVPASNLKLITTGAALHMLGEDYRFRTRLGYHGEVRDGTLHGDLYIIGEGDPTLGSKDSIATDIGEIFRSWEKMVKNAGIKRIEGHIVGDGRYFEGMPEEASWLWSDIGAYYGSGSTGLMFYENMLSFSVSAGKEVGAEINIKQHYPETPWMDFRYECSTGKAGSGDQLYMYTTDLAPIAVIRGTFGVDRAAKTVDCSNKFPELTCAHYFAGYLKSRGIECIGGAADFRLKYDTLKGHRADPDELRTIGETCSPSLSRIVFETNHASNNLYAETLLRTLGKELQSSACYDSSYVALSKALDSLGAKCGSVIQIKDGSGLSRQNHISPEYICKFLNAMMESPCHEAYLSSLPFPGGDGTLSYNMKKYPESLRTRIRVKSGSMNGVRCYSGYILPSSPESGKKPLAFSIMVNNCTAPNWKTRPLLDKMMAEIAERW